MGIETGSGLAAIVPLFVRAFRVDLDVGFILVEERQSFRPADVEGVVAFDGLPRCVFTGPPLVSLRCTKSSRSERRPAASAFASFSSSCLILACSPVASGLGSPSAPGASARSIAFSALVSS